MGANICDNSRKTSRSNFRSFEFRGSAGCVWYIDCIMYLPQGSYVICMYYCEITKKEEVEQWRAKTSVSCSNSVHAPVLHDSELFLNSVREIRATLSENNFDDNSARDSGPFGSGALSTMKIIVSQDFWCHINYATAELGYQVHFVV